MDNKNKKSPPREDWDKKRVIDVDYELDDSSDELDILGFIDNHDYDPD